MTAPPVSQPDRDFRRFKKVHCSTGYVGDQSNNLHKPVTELMNNMINSRDFRKILLSKNINPNIPEVN